jgi:ribosomal protein S21
MAKVHIEVKKNANENGTALIRRFTRKVMDAQIIQEVKGRRYNERPISALSQKVVTVRRLKRRAENDKLRKQGKLPEKKTR